MSYHTSPFILSQRSINKFDAKPVRTSYASMSSWFYVDDDVIPTERNIPDFGKSDLEKSTYFDEPSTNKFQIPSIEPKINYQQYSTKTFYSRNNFSNNDSAAPSSRLFNDFLMQTWKQKAQETNRSNIEIKNPDRKGRSGAGGNWSNISQASKHDGNKFLFMQGPRQKIDRNELTKKLEETPKPKFGELESRRLGVQTRYGVDHGNWNLIR